MAPPAASCVSDSIVAESIARIFFRIGISYAVPTFICPGVTILVEDGEEIEIDVAKGIARNLRTGKSSPISKYPPSIDRILQSGGITSLLIERLRSEGEDIYEEHRQIGILRTKGHDSEQVERPEAMSDGHAYELSALMKTKGAR